MARRNKSRTAEPSDAPSRAWAPDPGSLGCAVTVLGWLLLVSGAIVTATTGLASVGPIGVAAGAVLVALSGPLRRRDRAHRDRPRSSRVAFTVAAVCIGGGVVGLYWPAFLTRTQLATLDDTAIHAPLLAFAALVIGGGAFIVGLARQGSSVPPFALEHHDPAFLSVGKLLELNPKRFFIDTWRELDREAEQERRERAAQGKGYDWGPLVVLCTGAVFLAAMEYFGHAPTFREIVDVYDPPGRFGPANNVFGVIRDSPFRGLSDFMWWSGWRVLGFFLLPLLVIKLVLRGRVADYGLSTTGFLDHAWIYVLFFCVVLVFVGLVSFEDSFKTYYPFYKLANRSWYDFWAWEVLYAAQFFSLEFFFRGFWLHGAKRAMGSHAIYAMVVPYCMIHFGKPFLETLAAILAGVVLGTLSMRTRSIWSGFLIHVSVAVSMDLAALLQTTGLPTTWWPLL